MVKLSGSRREHLNGFLLSQSRQSGVIDFRSEWKMSSYHSSSGDKCGKEFSPLSSIRIRAEKADHNDLQRGPNVKLPFFDIPQDKLVRPQIT